jgi:hypothetical protein
MESPLQLPLSVDELPAAIRKFCDPKAPMPARMMAAKGLVPVRGVDQITMLAQLHSASEEDVSSAAKATLLGLPEGVMHSACSAELPAAVLDLLARLVVNKELLGQLVANPATHDATVERIARTADEMLCERIATNEQRLLRTPDIIEALYKNRNARMSTADRLVELAARNGIELTGIPAFKAHVEALQGQLLPEPSDEPLPQDLAFAQSLAQDADENVFETDDVAGTEAVRDKFKPLNMQILDMSKAEKLRLAMVGNMAARALLVRDHSKQIAFAAVSSPMMTAGEAADIAKSKEVSEEVLRYIGSKKEFLKNAEVKTNLIFNPKTPVGVSLKFLSHLRLNDLKRLSKSRNVSAQLKSLAAQWVLRREKE